MVKVSKKYASKDEAKKEMRRIFGVGLYDTKGTHASAKFIDGIVIEDGSLELSSDFWSETSLQEALKVGVDKL